MAYPSDLVRTKNWGTEVLTDTDLEGQFDLIIAWVMAALDSTSGHDHSATSNKAPKVNAITGLKVTSQAQGDILYASSATAFARLGAGTAGQYLKTNGAAANPSWADAPAGGILGAFKNLKIVRTSVTQVTVTADELILEDSSNVKITIRSVSEVAAITTSGASGLDTGAEGSSTWYYIWIIRKSSDGTTDALLSTSSSSPTMPSGYDQKALVGAVRNDGSSNFVNFKQYGRHYCYVAWISGASGNVGSTWTAIDTTAIVPSALSEVCWGNIVGNGISGISNINTAGNIGTTANDQRVEQGTSDDAPAWFFDILTANTLYWQSNNADCEVFIGGFIITKLN